MKDNEHFQMNIKYHISLLMFEKSTFLYSNPKHSNCNSIQEFDKDEYVWVWGQFLNFDYFSFYTKNIFF